jgi:hypothetical protein
MAPPIAPTPSSTRAARAPYSAPKSAPVRLPVRLPVTTIRSPAIAMIVKHTRALITSCAGVRDVIKAYTAAGGTARSAYSICG